MLILSRKEDQSVVFPNCGIVIRVLSVRGRTIKLGFEAPKEIEVLRGELVTENYTILAPIATNAKVSSDANTEVLGQQVHDLKNKLSTVSLAIHLYNELCARGLIAEAEQTLRSLIDNLAKIDSDWKGGDVSKLMEVAGVYSRTSPVVELQPDLQGKLRLLVVDDDPNERELLAGLLEMKGCQCMTAASGNEALEVMENNARFDFALLDMHMPDRDGASTLRAIRANDRYAKLKVFSVSGTSPSEVGATIGGDGFDGWLSKPLNPSTLWNHLQESLRREHANA